MAVDGAAELEDAVEGVVRRGDRVATVQQLRELVDRTRPVSTAEQRVLPVLPAVEGLLAGRGLQRGTVVQVNGGAGATSLALAVAAGPTRAGSWVACVGLPELGWAAAAASGVELERLVVVRPTEQSWATVVAALVDAFDVVLCGLERAPSSSEVRRLQARARERGSVLVVVAGAAGSVGPARRSWPEAADVDLSVVGAEWAGLGDGWGHLRSRRITVETGGRRGMRRGRRVELWLPGPSGGPEPVADGDRARHPDDGRHDEGRHDEGRRGATVTPLRRVG